MLHHLSGTYHLFSLSQLLFSAVNLPGNVAASPQQNIVIVIHIETQLPNSNVTDYVQRNHHCEGVPDECFLWEIDKRRTDLSLI